MVRLGSKYCVTRHIAGSIRDLETEIVEPKRLNQSRGNPGYIKILRLKERL